MSRLIAHGIYADDAIAMEVREVIDSHRNPLHSLHSVHCQISMINNHYNIIVSNIFCPKYMEFHGSHACIMLFKNPLQKTLGVHLDTRNAKGVTTAVLKLLMNLCTYHSWITLSRYFKMMISKQGYYNIQFNFRTIITFIL